MHGLRVPATGKTTRYPPSFELVTSFLVLMVPPCRFFPASHFSNFFKAIIVKKKSRPLFPRRWDPLSGAFQVKISVTIHYFEFFYYNR